MKNWFWTICGMFAIILATPSVALAAGGGNKKAPTANAPAAAAPAASGNSSNVNNCDDVRECLASVQASTKTVYTWKVCEAQRNVQVRFDAGTGYTVHVNGDKAIIERGQCICPEGYNLSKSWRLANVQKSQDGSTKTEYYEGMGLCLPKDVEPNAEVIVDGLNRLFRHAQDVNYYLMDHEQKLGSVQADLAGLKQSVELNADAIRKMRGELERNSSFVSQACDSPNVPKSWAKICNASKRLDALEYNRNLLRFGLSANYSRYPGRNFFGAGIEGGLMTQRMNPESPLRLELGGRLTLGSAEKMEPSGDSTLVTETSLYVGPVFDLDEEGRYKLHTRGMAQLLWQNNGFNLWGRRYGGELAVSVCPFAEARSQRSFCFVPNVNLTHGRSAFPLQPTLQNPNPGNRGESNVTMGAGLMIGGQF